MIYLYLTEEEVELLELLAQRDGKSIEDSANDLFHDLLERIWDGLENEVLN